MQFTRLTDEQRRFFDAQGFLVVRNALPPAMVERVRAASDRLYDGGKGFEGTNDKGYWNLRNCIVHDDVFLELLDWPATVPLAVQLLNWNLRLITSHLIIREPSPSGSDDAFKSVGWHRDGGTSPTEMSEPHPRLFLKIAYWLTDTAAKGMGAIRFIPGSHRFIGPPPREEGAVDPIGAVEMSLNAGDAVFFEQRMYHAVGPNFAPAARKSVFFGYAYRWIQPMDYVQMPDELLAKADPIQRQLLGDIKTQLGFYLPTDDDVPLRAWLREHRPDLLAK